MSVLIFIVILVILILVHEFGHFITAKKSGIRVDEFGIGFPPKVFGKKYGETEYTVNALPFGGFVKIFGENPDEESLNGPDSKRSFINQPRWVQAMVLSAGVIFNIVFAWILLTVGLMIGVPAAIDDSINPAYVSEERLLIVGVLEETPAFTAGIISGDEIQSLGVGEEQLLDPTSESVSGFISSHPDSEIEVTVLRDKVEQSFLIIPITGVVEGDTKRAAIGISMAEVGVLQLPFYLAPIEAAKRSAHILYAIATVAGGLIWGALTLSADLSGIAGPVGIVGLVGDTATLGIIALLQFTAIISLNLAVINILPFPALDGGRLFFLLIEAIKRSPIKPSVANAFNSIGFILLILLLIAVTYNDIARIIAN